MRLSEKFFFYCVDVEDSDPMNAYNNLEDVSANQISSKLDPNRENILNHLFITHFLKNKKCYCEKHSIMSQKQR